MLVAILIAFSAAVAAWADEGVRPSKAMAEQTTPPVPGAPRAANIPTPTDKTLSNGLRVIVIPKSGVPLVAARLLIKTGGEADPADKAGLADMTASLLTKGTTTKSAEEIARGVEALGAAIESGAGWDYSYVAISSLANNFGEAMKYMADVVRNPVFAKDEVDRLREQNIDALSVDLKDPARLARFVANRVVYGGGPYGHNLGGTPKSLEGIKSEDAAAFRAKWYRPENAIFVVAGTITPDDAIAIAEKSFGDWKATGPMPENAGGGAGATQNQEKPRVVVIDMPDAGQAAVMVTRRGISRTDPAYITSQVANAVLGGGYSSRLNEEIRIKRGLSYGAGSSFDFRREAGPFFATAQTKNESAGEVAAIINEQLSAMTSTSVPESELTPRKAVLLGNFGRALETEAGLVSRVATLALYGLPLGDLSHYISDVQGVTAEQVKEFAAGHFPDEDVVIVGDMKKFGDEFKKRFPDAEIIPIAQLDLDSPALRKP
ncbi:MAG TPA: pitrilysin family protein [Thermoanaerobaculia bacterium]